MTDQTSSTGSYVPNPAESLTPPFELEQLGLRVELVPRLVDPYGLGVWIAEQDPHVQAQMLDGWLQGLGEPPADLMARMVQIGRDLRRFTHLPTITGGLEHLLTTLRTRKDTDDAQPE